MSTGVDLEKLRQKVQYVRDTRRHLSAIRDRGRDVFLSDRILEAAATRYLHTGIEAMIDAANHIISREGLGLPKTYHEAMSLLLREGILPREMASTLERMVKFRNRAVHLYDEISPEEIWGILDNHLGDFERFLEAIVRRYFMPE
ncbi:MAG: DUF86 domain-containing protein [Thermoanaerobaculia bacterium]|nr:DUF86 domain-containing protein [Thermoanaerobaculia bacterium]